MRTVEVKLYQFDELSDKAKDKAREWWRECEAQEFGAHGDIYEPAETAANLLGVTFNTNDVRLMSGKTRPEPDIRWSGFHSQGDGASFTGSYAYRKGSARDIRREFGDDASGQEVKRIARELAALQRKHGYKLTADVRQCGHYVHHRTMYVDIAGPQWLDYSDRQQEAEQLGEAIQELMCDFAKWIYSGLVAEYEYRMSDEHVDDAIRANEYYFREDGTRSDG